MIELFLAFLADLRFGDPVYRFHPVKIMGGGITRSETFLRKVIKNNFLGGFCLAIFFPLGVFGIALTILYICYQIHPLLAAMMNIFGIYTTISIHDLRKEAVQIHEDLTKKCLVCARTHLARIVGRDTNKLNENEITRATVETVAESTVDGIVSPLFYAALGGAPLALAYKAINTLDSMIGHRNERYKEFGYFSAKIDDIANWLPARLSYSFICIATLLTRLNPKSAFMAGAKELKVYNSISNLPEATFAGALQIRLGGTNVYAGHSESKPYLGIEKKAYEPKLILDSIRLMLSSAWVTLVFCLMITFLIQNGIES